MRVCIVLMFAFLALTYAAVEEETVDGARVKRQFGNPHMLTPRKGTRCLVRPPGGCRCWSWGYVHCHLRSWGCFCHGPNDPRWGGCQVDVPHLGHMHWCVAEHHDGAHCRCRDNIMSKPVNCNSE